jgi:hypothetical protein
MHGRVAAGKLTDVNFDDEGKRILVAAKIVDDDEWEKVLEGVYTGFSQGGRYVNRWADPETGLTRYTADPMEISLVDLPCLPDGRRERAGRTRSRRGAGRRGVRRNAPCACRRKGPDRAGARSARQGRARHLAGRGKA